MRWTSRLKRSVVPVVALTWVCGCHHYANVFVDDLPPSSMVTTPSMERARAAEVVSAMRRRGFEPVRVEAQDGTVLHGALLMEDPTEMSGSDDGRFEVTTEDLVILPYSVGRYVVNLLLMPFSMMVDPPGQFVCSDGVERRSRVSWLPEPYDAERCSGVAMPIDVQEAWTAGDAAIMETPARDDDAPVPPPGVND